jgi:hypothetical protein
MLVAALADIKSNLWIVDRIFGQLPIDTITKDSYGVADIDAAKTFFKNTKIPVLINPSINEFVAPCITIVLADSSEVVSELTLGDINYDSEESNYNTAPVLAGPFTPTSYDALTGIVTLAEELSCPIFVGMDIVDYKGTAHPITEVLSDTSFTVAENTVADFRNSVLKGAAPAWLNTIESASYKETFKIGVHTPAEPIYLTWLHAIVCYALFRYKEILLEGRGLERTGFSSTDVQYDPYVEGQLGFARFITLTGYVRQYWLKAVQQKVTGIELNQLKVIGAGNLPYPADAAVSLWVGDDD